MFNNIVKQALRKRLAPTQMRMFSGGPYNPLHFKYSAVPEELPS
jgi:hypothetical protein